MSKCCLSCTFCNKIKKWAAAKERRKTNIKHEKYNKVCEKCFFCKSLCFCPQCAKCPQCCKCPASGGATTIVLGSMGTTRCKPKSSVHTKRGLCSPIQSQTLPSEGSPDSKRLCQSHQRLPLARGSTSLNQEEGSREG